MQLYLVGNQLTVILIHLFISVTVDINTRCRVGGSTLVGFVCWITVNFACSQLWKRNIYIQTSSYGKIYISINT